MIMASTSMYQTRVTKGGSIGDIYVNTLKTDEHGYITSIPLTRQLQHSPTSGLKSATLLPSTISAGATTSTTKASTSDSSSLPA